MKTPPKKASPALYDAAAVADSYRLLIGAGNVTELRALEATTASDRFARTWFGYFDDADALVQAVGQLRSAKGIYIIPNQINPDLLSRCVNRLKPAGKGDATQDSDIIRRRWLLVDCDCVRPTNISANDAGHRAAGVRVSKIREHLRALGWPDPIEADSGNGAHLLYRLDIPADDGGLVQRCLQALSQWFSDAAVKVDESVHNAARIWKLYGTRACKGDSTAQRPHRMAKVLAVPEPLQNVPDEMLQALAGEVRTTQPAVVTVPCDGQPFDVVEFLARHALDVDGPSDWNGRQGPGQRWTFRTSPMCDHHDGAAHIELHASGAISAGCHHQSCGWGWRELRQTLEPTGNSRSQPAMFPAAPREQREPIALHRPFPIEILPSPLDVIVRRSAKSMGCDPSYVALPILSVLAAAIGSTRRIALKPGWTEPSIIWSAIVGESGTTKTPAFKLAVKPARALQSKALEYHAGQMQDHESRMARYDRDMARWKREKGDSDPPERPTQPQATRYVVSDTTVEALAPVLLANPRGVLLARDELAGWLGSFDRYAAGHGGDSAHWLSMHNGESLVVDRKTGQTRTIYVPSAYVSICGGIQPGILHRALGVEHRESGLAARLLLACPPRRPKSWTDSDIAPTVESAYAELLGRLYALRHTSDPDGQPAPIVLGLSPEAKARWVEFYDSHALEMVDLVGEMAAAWSKLEGYCARLALILHVVARAADGADEGSQVDDAAMERAVEMTDWFKFEARRVYGLLAEDLEDREQRLLVEWIERRGGVVTVRELQQGPRQYRESGTAETALQELAAAGLGRWKWDNHAGGRGRPVRVFWLGSTGYGNTNAKNPSEAVFVSPDTEADEERAAIQEFDGGLSREDAERRNAG